MAIAVHMAFFLGSAEHRGALDDFISAVVEPRWESHVAPVACEGSHTTAWRRSRLKLRARPWRQPQKMEGSLRIRGEAKRAVGMRSGGSSVGVKMAPAKPSLK
jgi:hypothetical protein